MAISAVGEGCHKQMEAFLPQIMDTVINFFSDPVSADPISFHFFVTILLHSTNKCQFFVTET